MPLAKSPASTPGRLAAEGLDSRLRGNGVILEKGAHSNDRPNAVRPYGTREEFFFCYVQSRNVIENT
jgi:hypothetical protein